MKKRNNTITTIINIGSSIGVLIINLCISFFLSPYIIRNIGVEANGFVTLANNFVMYADLIVTALNAMAARFITIAYVKRDYKTANLYYNSVFWGNLLIVAFLLVPAAVVIVCLENLINVPLDILVDVKILFFVVFLGFFIRTGAPNWDCGAYVSNRLDRTYIPGIFLSLFRCVLLVCMFSILFPRVWYVSVSSCLVTILGLCIAWNNTRELTPELRISLRTPIFSWMIIKELVGSGIWNSITSIGNMLLSGLDLLVCNIFLGATEMGILAISKTLPNILTVFSESIRGAFGPELTISFASGDRDSLLHIMKRSMKIAAVLISIPTAGIIIMSDVFYRLWLPTQDAELLHVLTVLAIFPYIISSGITPLNNVFPTVNKVKYNSMSLICSGLASVILTLTALHYTNYAVYAIAGMSSIVMIIRDLAFNIPVCAKLLGFKWTTFYRNAAVSIASCGIIIAVGYVVKHVIPVNSWGMFFLSCSIIGVLGLGLNLFIVLDKEERHFFISILRRKFLHR